VRLTRYRDCRRMQSIAALKRKSVILGIVGRYPATGASRHTRWLIAGIEGPDRYLGCYRRTVRSPCPMHMCDELAAFGRRAICTRDRMGRRTNGPVQHACQHGSAVVETICRRSSKIYRSSSSSLWEGHALCLAHRSTDEGGVAEARSEHMAALSWRTAHAKLPNHALPRSAISGDIGRAKLGTAGGARGPQSNQATRPEYLLCCRPSSFSSSDAQ
jgi:hypothetical protein